MKIPSNIDFTGLHKKVFFDETTPEYKALIKLRKDGAFKEYQEQQLEEGVSVIFDMSSNVFAIVPQTFESNELKESLEVMEDGNDIDIEADDDWLSELMNEEPDEESIDSIEGTAPELPKAEEKEYATWQDNNDRENENPMAITLEDIMSIMQQVLDNTKPNSTASTGESQDGPETIQTPGKSGSLVGGKEALKQAFFQGDGNEVLDSDFDAVTDDIQRLESHVDPNVSYVKAIGGEPKDNGVEQPALKGINMNNSDNKTSAKTVGIGDTVVDPGVDADGIDIKPAGPIVYGQDKTPGYYDDIEDGVLGPDRLISGLPCSGEDVQDYDFDDKDLLLDIEEEALVNGQDEDESSMMEAPGDGDFRHPDLDRFVAVDDNSPADEPFEVDFDEEELSPAYEEPLTPSLTGSTTANIAGQQVHIVLTGVMITMPEMKYIGESVRAAGNRLKEINGKGNQLKIVVEANKRQYTIDYVDQPTNKTKTPFSIKNVRFTSLQEALNRINNNNTKKEKEVFKHLMSDEYANRGTSNLIESDIFKGFEQVADISTWTVKNVGILNLKTGLNETFSRITQTGDEPNTLVVDGKGQHILIKGNLKERSKIGTRKELVDLREKKSYGNVEVVGIYENTAAGLGDLMYDIKRTSIPLLVWK